MPEATTTPTESVLFETGSLFVELRFRAERDWCDADEVEGFADLQRVAAIARRLSAMITSLADRQHRQDPAPLTAFAIAVEGFLTHFRAAWRGTGRVDKLEELRSTMAEPELGYEQERYLYQGSPLQDGHWGAVQAAAEQALALFEPPQRECFRISVLLGSEIYPTFIGGQCERDSDLELGYLTVDFAKQVEQRMTVLGEEFPFLARLKVDFASTATPGEAIDSLRMEIGRRLQNPAGAPGYLDLILDRAGGRVSRHGVSVELTSNTLWQVLVRLESSGPGICTRQQVGSALKEDSEAAIDQAISTLRRHILKPLGLHPKLLRKEGWTLKELS